MRWNRRKPAGGKEEAEAAARGGASRWLLYSCLGASLLMASAALFGREGILEVVAVHRRLGALRGDMERLRLENRRLRREIDSLRHDLAAIERIAREDLGLVKPGELVYEFLEGRPRGGR